MVIFCLQQKDYRCNSETNAKGVVEEEELVGDVEQPAVYAVDTRDSTDTCKNIHPYCTLRLAFLWSQMDNNSNKG